MGKAFWSRDLTIGTGFAMLLGGLVVSQVALQGTADAQRDVTAPKFEVDPFWPKPMPNGWVMGMTIGLWVDANDTVWVVHRANTVDRTLSQADRGLGECCKAAPPVLAFDRAGNLLHSWGGPGQGYDWPESNHGIFVDHKGAVWIGGNGGPDSHILKFTQDGRFLAQFGKAGARRQAGARADANAESSQAGFVGNSNDPDSFGRVAKVFVDARNNEAYVADGYLNKRVAVIDGDTGKMKRYWGAYGNKPDDAPLGAYDPKAPKAQQFRTPVHCADLSVDRLVYVCDRANNRLQVFTEAGKFVKEVVYKPDTRADGSVWDVAFSRDPQQKFLFIADGVNERVVVMDRKDLQVLTTFGGGGNHPGEFHGVHSIATDSRNNIFTTETYGGRRVQKFVYKGDSAVTKFDQGVPRPDNR